MAEKYNDYEEYGENENGGDTEPSKTKMILFVAVAFLMVAAAVLFFVAQRSGDSESAQTGDQEKSDQGAKKNGASEYSPSDSGSAALESDSNQEYNYTAPASGDCAGLASPEEVQLCLDNIAAAKAIQSKNLSACYALETEILKFNCIAKIARDEGNADLCGGMSDDTAKYRCIAAIATDQNNMALCEKIPEQLRLDCENRVLAFSISRDGDKDSLYKCRKLNNQEYIELCFFHSFMNKFGGDCDLVPQAYRQDCVKLFQ